MVYDHPVTSTCRHLKREQNNHGVSFARPCMFAMFEYNMTPQDRVLNAHSPTGNGSGLPEASLPRFPSLLVVNKSDTKLLSGNATSPYKDSQSGLGRLLGRCEFLLDRSSDLSYKLDMAVPQHRDRRKTGGFLELAGQATYLKNSRLWVQ